MVLFVINCHLSFFSINTQHKSKNETHFQDTLMLVVRLKLRVDRLKSSHIIYLSFDARKYAIEQLQLKE